MKLPANEQAGQEAHICTVLTKDYLLQGLALYYSLQRHTARFRLWILCVDDTAYSVLEKMNLPNVHLISLHNIRTRNLAKIERERQIHEFCWTLKAELLTYLLKNNFNLRSILYVDADLFFFKSVSAIYGDWAAHSVYITQLWLGPLWQKKVGRYSAGLIGFKRDKTGRQCLQLWREKCLNWCYDRREKGRWGDQKYLDDWPRLFSGVKISGHKGINAGPWNIKRASIHSTDNNVIYYDRRELVCYHFSGFRVINEREFVLCDRKKLPAGAEKIYAPYVEEIRRVLAKVSAVDKGFIRRLAGRRRLKLFNRHVLKNRG